MKRILVFLIVLLCSFSIFCTTTWTWSSPYKNTYGFRYQFDGDDGDNWTYVSPSVTTLTLDNVPEDTTLYVQLSLDGVNWSPSGIATYLPKEEETVEEKGISIVSADDVRMNRNFEFAFDFDFGADMFYSQSLNVVPYVGAVLDFKNIYSPTYWFGLGLRVKSGLSFAPIGGKNIITVFVDGNGFADLDKSAYLDASLALSFILVDSVDLTVSLGGGLSLLSSTFPSLFTIGDYEAGVYAVAGATLDRYFGQMFHLGISYYFKHFFADGAAGLNLHSLGFHLGLTF